MFHRRFFLALVACAILSSSTAFAGSGGTKKDATITVRNDTSRPIAAFVDPDAAKISALPVTPTEAQINSAGGQLVNPGSTATFKVSAGTYVLAAGNNPASPASTSVTIGKGQKKNYSFTGSALVAY